MFKSKHYAQIFDQRGASYHRAMQDYPHARDHEFEAVLKYAQLKGDEIIADYPAGGAYLFAYLKNRGIAARNYFPLETSTYFCALNDFENAELHDESQLQLGSSRFDCLISLAGLHHLDRRREYYRHFFDVLKTGGRVVIADVMAGTRPAEFLNGFVDQHSELGHNGNFLGESDLDGISAAGFAAVSGKVESYSWEFSSANDRATYCKQMFGLRAGLAEIDQRIVELFEPSGADLPWQLYVMSATKP